MGPLPFPVIPRACDFFDLFVFQHTQPAAFQAPDKAVILSEALRRSIANRGFMARSRRACPERSRRNPGDACWQMLLGAFRPQTTGEEKKITTSEGSGPKNS